MEWISVKDRFPADKVPVMVTVRRRTDGDFSAVMKDVVWNPEKYGCWGWNDGEGYFEYLDGDLEVTHWMQYPDPAPNPCEEARDTERRTESMEREKDIDIKWISIEERKPATGVPVIVATEERYSRPCGQLDVELCAAVWDEEYKTFFFFNSAAEGRYENRWPWDEKYCLCKVTHWMPYPKPPDVEGEHCARNGTSWKL